MVAVSLAVGGFPTIFLARQKFDWHFRAFCRLADKVGIRVVRVVCGLYVRKKVFRSFSSFRMRAVCRRAASSCGESADYNVRKL